MNKELHKKALEAAYQTYWNDDDPTMHFAIAAYLKTAGLTVVPDFPTEKMVKATSDIVVGYDDFSCGDGTIYLYDDAAIDAYGKMLAAFPSPFKDMP